MRHHAYCRSLAACCRFVLPLGVRCRSHHACIWCRRVVHVCTWVHDNPGREIHSAGREYTRTENGIISCLNVLRFDFMRQYDESFTHGLYGGINYNNSMQNSPCLCLDSSGWWCLWLRRLMWPLSGRLLLGVAWLMTLQHVLQFFLTNEQLITLDLARLLMVAKFHVLIIFQNLIEIWPCLAKNSGSDPFLTARVHGVRG